MDIYEFSNLCSDDSCIVAVWDYRKEDEVFCGELREAVDSFGDCEIMGIDLINPNGQMDKRGVSVILNIESEEDEEDEEEATDYQEPQFNVDLVSDGGIRYHWNSYITEEEANEEIERYNGRWIDENGYCWHMEVSENW